MIDLPPNSLLSLRPSPFPQLAMGKSKVVVKPVVEKKEKKEKSASKSAKEAKKAAAAAPVVAKKVEKAVKPVGNIFLRRTTADIVLTFRKV